jgi:NADH:ubiquinone oxidoreductase subunit 6 (subunit J)
VAALMFGVLLIQATLVVLRFAGDIKFDPAQAGTVTSREVALVLMTKYLYAFETTSVMLLIAVIGAMSLARRRVFPGSAAQRREG